LADSRRQSSAVKRARLEAHSDVGSSLQIRITAELACCTSEEPNGIDGKLHVLERATKYTVVAELSATDVSLCSAKSILCERIFFCSWTYHLSETNNSGQACISQQQVECVG